MSNKEIDRKKIESLLPHREPMLLIDELINIKNLHSATAIMNVKKDSFYVDGHFPGQPVMPGVLIVEAFGQAAAALTAHGIDKETYENKLVFLMSIEKARFRNPVIPNCKLLLNILSFFPLSSESHTSLFYAIIHDILTAHTTQKISRIGMCEFRTTSIKET